MADGDYKGMNNYIDYTAVRHAFPVAHSLLVLGLEVSSGARCSLHKHRWLELFKCEDLDRTRWCAEKGFEHKGTSCASRDVHQVSAEQRWWCEQWD